MIQCLLIVAPGMEDLTSMEVKELGGRVIDDKHLIAEFEGGKFKEYVFCAQSPVRVVVLLAGAKSIDSLEWGWPWRPISSFNLTYDGIHGQSVRDNCSRVMIPRILSYFAKNGNPVSLERKNPQARLMVVRREGKSGCNNWGYKKDGGLATVANSASETGSLTEEGKGLNTASRIDETYYLGIDVGGDLARRPYRVFAHASSFRGDSAYRVIREIGYCKGEKLLVGMAKDGVLAIEAVMYSGQGRLRRDLPDFLMEADEQGLSWKAGDVSKNEVRKREISNPRRQEVVSETNVVKNAEELGEGYPDVRVWAFDTTPPNVKAAEKNSYLAGVKSAIIIRKCFLEELDVIFEPAQFDKILMIVTQKDEGKLNEIYHQSSYLCRPGGIIAILARERWELMVPDQFKVERKVMIAKGQQAMALWVLKNGI